MKVIYTNKFEPTYRRDTGLWVLNFEDVELPEGFIVNEKDLVYIPPRVVAGNHKHPRIEAFVGVGDLEFAWIDTEGKFQSLKMYENNTPQLILVYPFVPHAVRNLSQNSIGLLYEMANGPQKDVEMVEVLKPQ